LLCIDFKKFSEDQNLFSVLQGYLLWGYYALIGVP
jgi:hypothetical protein